MHAAADGATTYFTSTTAVTQGAVWSAATYGVTTDAEDRTVGGLLTAVAIGATVGALGALGAGYGVYTGGSSGALSTAWEQSGPIIQSGLGNGVGNTAISGLRHAGFDVDNLM